MNKTIIAPLAALLLSGCASTRSMVTEFDSAGNITRQTDTSSSIISTLMSSTQNKSVIIWEDGWAAYISCSTGTIEDPTPHGKIFCGKVNKGWVSVHQEQQNVENIASIIKATKSDITVTPEGITAQSSK